jgi:N-acetyl-gamma-glutamyl-phosphate reductase
MLHNYDEKNSKKSTSQSPVSCAVVGARGYSGLELIRLLQSHPFAKITACYATRAFNLAEELADDSLSAIACLTDDQILNTDAEVVFLATPAEVSLELAPKLAALGKKVIDLSGAFRLKRHATNEWYPFSNTTPELQTATYGLWPFTPANAFAKSSGIVANPGCYATAAALALIPLVKSGLVDTNHLVIDAKSGVTGAGRKASESILFAEVDGDCVPYKVGKHQHYPEIVETVENATGTKLDFHFTTHLLPIRRGLSVSLYARLTPAALKASPNTAALASAFDEYYKNDPFIQHGSIAEKPYLLSIKKVTGTARANIGYSIAGDKVFVFCAIDNLLKGASSQAIENFNAWMDFPRTTGLLALRGQA